MRARPSRLAGGALALAGALLSGCTAAAAAAAPVVDDATSSPTRAVPADPRSAASVAAGCLSRADWIADGLPGESWDAAPLRTRAADVTGDGTADTLVELHCPVPASGSALDVVVFDGRTGAVLDVLDGGLFFQDATVTVAGTSVTIEGRTVAGDDPYCCGAHRGSAVYRWTDGRFVLAEQTEVLSTEPISSEALPDGGHVAAVRAARGGEVWLDVVEWLEGEAVS